MRVNKNRKREIIKEENIFIKPNFTFEQDIKNCEKEYFLFIGRIEEIKGIDILIEAFCGLPKEKLIIAGTGTGLEHYKKKALSAKADNIEFAGYLSKEELNGKISGAKAVIVASQWYETFGMIIAEAFSAHVPVITGDIGNIGTLVEAGKTGLKFKYDSAKAAKDHAKKLDSEESKYYYAVSKNAIIFSTNEDVLKEVKQLF